MALRGGSSLTTTFRALCPKKSSCCLPDHLQCLVSYMSMIPKSLRVASVGLMISAVAAWASPTGPSTIQGDVKDSKAQPVAGAEVHIQAKDGTGFYRVVHTDGNGHYAVSKLPNTDYEVVLFVNGS